MTDPDNGMVAPDPERLRWLQHLVVEPAPHDHRGTLRGFVAGDVELAAGQLWASMVSDRPARTAGFSVLEAVACWAGQRHTETPASLSPVLAAFARRWEHGLGSAGQRAMLKQFIPALPNTVDPAVDEALAVLAIDWLARHAVPLWLDHAEVVGWPDRLRATAAIRSPADCDALSDQITAAMAKVTERAERDPVNAAPLARRAVDASAVSSAHMAAHTFRCERPWPRGSPAPHTRRRRAERAARRLSVPPLCFGS